MNGTRLLRLCEQAGTAVLRGLWTVLMHYGAATAGVPLPADPSRSAPGTGGPPAAHPESLAWHLPPSAVERQLWAQLRGCQGKL
jgi:hypothetical protein